VHESKDRVKDVFSSQRWCVVRVRVLCGARGQRSPPRHPSDIRCHRCGGCYERIPTAAHGPTEVFVPTTPREERRLPENRDAFHHHEREGVTSRRDCSPRPSRRHPRSRRPHFVLRLGTVFWLGIARHECGHPLDPCWLRECRRFFDSLELPRLGLTTQARHRARPTRPSTRTDCLARTDAGRSA
jgi:hypothetical protein